MGPVVVVVASEVGQQDMEIKKGQQQQLVRLATPNIVSYFGLGKELSARCSTLSVNEGTHTTLAP